MCTLSIISLSGKAPWPLAPVGLRVVASRDEERDRPAALAPRWRPLDLSGPHTGATRAIWPTDPLGGGTWIAAADSGLVICLLNRNLEPEPQLPPGLLSRGRIIPSLIASPGAKAALDALDGLDLDRFAPFRLVAVESGADGKARVLEASWDRHGLARLPETTAPACMVSSGLGDSKVQKRLKVFEETVLQSGMSPQAQDHFHLHVWPDHPELSVLMSRPDARTVSITTVEVSSQAGVDGAFGVRMGYQPVMEGGRLGLSHASGGRPVVVLGRGG